MGKELDFQGQGWTARLADLLFLCGFCEVFLVNFPKSNMVSVIDLLASGKGSHITIESTTMSIGTSTISTGPLSSSQTVN